MTDGRTGVTKLRVAFRNFVNVTNKEGQTIHNIHQFTTLSTIFSALIHWHTSFLNMAYYFFKHGAPINTNFVHLYFIYEN